MKHSFACHRILVFVLSLVLALGGVAAPWAVRPAAAGDATVVFSALNILKGQHFTRPDPVRLLAAAVDGLRRALAQAGVPQPFLRLTATGEADAREEFQWRFDEAAAVAEGRLTERALQYAAVRAMAESFDDSHTIFLTPEQRLLAQRGLTSQAGFSGIGIRLLARDGRFYIRQVYPDTPAARAGLRPFDRILAVDAQGTAGMRTEDLTQRIRGPQGTSVSLTVQRAGQPLPVALAMTRVPIVPASVDVRLLPGGVGYISLTRLGEGSAGRLRRAIQDLQQQGMRALVLDLRGNSGGLAGETVAACSALLPSGLPVIVRESRARRITDVTAGGPALPAAVPLVVLADGGTGSGAEVITAAVQEYRRGTVVGTRTAGALLFSVHFPLPGGAALQVATSSVTTGMGAVVEKTGVRPDVEVELTPDDLERGVDSQLQYVLAQLLPRLLAAVAPAA